MLRDFRKVRRSEGDGVVGGLLLWICALWVCSWKLLVVVKCGGRQIWSRRIYGVKVFLRENRRAREDGGEDKGTRL